MNVINWYNKNVLQYIGGYQPIDKNVKYRLSKFVIEYWIGNDGVLLMNTMLGSLVFLTKEEYDNIFLNSKYNEYLIKTYFLVKEGFNEYKVVDTYGDDVSRKRTERLENPIYDKINSFTIVTTTKCNARCYYCFQHEEIKKRKDTSKETIDDIIKWILERCDKDKEIHLQWFGGEPLYNIPLIDYVCDKLNENNIKFNSETLSNGYYFTEDIVKKAVSKWMLNKVQITLDGTEKSYNKIKNYINKDDNPFLRVINNIKLLLKANINVNVRLNCSERNIDDMIDLVVFLSNEFGEYKNFYMYSTPLFEVVAHESINTDIFVEKFIKLREVLSEYYFAHRHKQENYDLYMQGIKYNSCMGDDLKHVMINENGELFNCQHWNHPVGSIYSNEQDIDFLKEFTNHISLDNELCGDCKLRPVCLYKRGCPGSTTNGCQLCKTENDKKLRLHLMELNAQYLFRMYIKDVINYEENKKDYNNINDK